MCVSLKQPQTWKPNAKFRLLCNKIEKGECMSTPDDIRRGRERGVMMHCGSSPKSGPMLFMKMASGRRRPAAGDKSKS